ncbi:hypothetical protein BGZ57DRAFT_735182, partial [Hyaloscypha finlandica]
FLTIINNEAKVRYSTKSLVLGKAKVISYKDLVEVRAKQVVKEVTRVAKGKGKRGRKRKKEDTIEEDTIRSARRGRKRKSTTLNVPTLVNK